MESKFKLTRSRPFYLILAMERAGEIYSRGWTEIKLVIDIFTGKMPHVYPSAPKKILDLTPPVSARAG
jgi:hypothetical protein